MKTKRSVMIGGDNIEYILNKRRGMKNMRLTVCCEGSVMVTAPKWLSIEMIEDFIAKKATWIFRKKSEMVESFKGSLFCQKSQTDYFFHKEEARRIVEKKLEKFNSFYGFEYKRVFIRDQRTRWGSCSSNKNLNFNFRILFLPELLVDYLIVHELCHLKEMNHSKRFWNLVSQTIPNPKEISKQLKHM